MNELMTRLFIEQPLALPGSANNTVACLDMLNIVSSGESIVALLVFN